MTGSVFLDTFGLIALLNKDDSHHKLASEKFNEIGRNNRKIVTTDLVLGEFGNSLSRTSLRREVVWLIRQLSLDVRSEVVFVEPTLFAMGLKLFESREDKKWGLVDCVSFALMSERGISSAFTGDVHFEQAGFECLLGVRRH